jgi:hypothetical protein
MDSTIAERRPTFIPGSIGRFSMETVMGAHPGKPKSDQSSFLELIAYCVLRPVDGHRFPYYVRHSA